MPSVRRTRPPASGPGASRPLRFAVGALAAIAVAAGLALPATASARAEDKPSAIVSMGDSFISGESAGDYESGTDQSGNFCHRSKVAEIHETGITADRYVNLACSGATTENVRLGGAALNGEAPQAEQLRAVARADQVKLVVVSVGGNDVGFSDLVLDCIKAYFRLGDRCQEKWAGKLPGDLAAAEPRIVTALKDVRSVMSDAGYADSDYQLVLQSYPSPVTGDNRYTFTKTFEGCPVRDDDAQWARDDVVSQFAATMAQAAQQAGARFMDLSHAFYDREVCANGIDHDQEWASGIDIDVAQIKNGFGTNIVQQSLHPDALGHAQFGHCLSAFFAASDPAARCQRGADGNLTPVATTFDAVRAARRTALVPDRHEPKPITDERKAYAKERALRARTR